MLRPVEKAALQLFLKFFNMISFALNFLLNV